jgi:hypothetical protein
VLCPEPVRQKVTQTGLEFPLSGFPGGAIDELVALVIEGYYAAAGWFNIVADAVRVATVSPPAPVPAVTRHPTLFFP